MAKLGMEKKKMATKIKEEQVDHKHVPGKAYNIENPSVKLINMIGGGFFNELRYYDTNRSSFAFMAELLENGKITSKIVDEAGLTEQARDVLAAAVSIAQSDAPEDLLIIAAWARDPKDGLKIRTTPQILLAVAAHFPKTKPFVAKYAPFIVRRADEISQVFAAYRHLFQSKKEGGLHKGSLPHSLRKGLAKAFQKFGEKDFLKYAGETPSFANVLLMIKQNGIKKAAVSKEVFEYIVNGKLLDESKTPVFAAREKFNALKADQFDEVTNEMMEAAAITWENLVSKFGSSQKVWERCIPHMGEMALVRNLRNFEEAKISDKAWQSIYDSISENGTKMLPFRFYTASKMTSSTTAKSILGKMMDRACENLPELKGVTLAVTDNSGSAQGATVSEKSIATVAEAGNMLMSVIAKKCGINSHIGVFGDSYKEVPFSKSDSCLSIMEKIQHYAINGNRKKDGYLAIPAYQSGEGVGQGTETGMWWAIQSLIDKKTHVDRIIFLSDLCCYTQGDVNCGNDMSKYFGKDATIQSMIEKYRQAVNKDVEVYSVNLSGHEQAQTKSSKKSHLLSGWSEQLINTIANIEGAKAQGTTAEIVSLEVLRNKYQVK